MAFTLPVVYYSQPILPAYSRPIIVQRFWGVVGAQVLKSRVQERTFPVEVTLTNHTNLSDIMAAIAQMDEQLDSEESASLFIDGIEYPNCTFLGYQPSEPPFRDASGVHGWTQRGTVHFLQTKETPI